MAFSTAWRYAGAGLVGGVGGAYLGDSPFIGAGVGVGGYGLYRSGVIGGFGRGLAGRLGPMPTAGGGIGLRAGATIGKRIPPGVKSAFRSGGRLLGKALVGLEAVMIASEIKEGRGIASDVYEAYNQNDPIGAAQGIAGGLGSYALTAYFLGPQALALAPLIAAKEMYSLGETGRKHLKRLRKTELYGSPELLRSIHSPGAATMRQRSLLALQNTHINARMGLGGEAMMIHTPFR